MMIPPCTECRRALPRAIAFNCSGNAAAAFCNNGTLAAWAPVNAAALDPSDIVGVIGEFVGILPSKLPKFISRKLSTMTCSAFGKQMFAVCRVRAAAGWHRHA
ncbi:MAG: hypothetical protein R2881_09700 [Eubacteriales bacterium]